MTCCFASRPAAPFPSRCTNQPISRSLFLPCTAPPAASALQTAPPADQDRETSLTMNQSAADKAGVAYSNVIGINRLK